MIQSKLFGLLAATNLLALPLTPPSLMTNQIPSPSLTQVQAAEAPAQVIFLPATLAGEPALQIQVQGDLPANSLMTFAGDTSGQTYEINGDGLVVLRQSADTTEILTLDHIPNIQNIITSDDGTEIRGDQLEIQRQVLITVDGQLLFVNNELGQAFDQDLILTLTDDQGQVQSVDISAGVGEASLDLAPGTYTVTQASSQGQEVEIADAMPILLEGTEDSDQEPAEAQTNASLQVTVTDQATGEGVPEVAVRVSDAQDQMMTEASDASGQVTFTDLAPGTYQVELLDIPVGYQYIEENGQEVFSRSVDLDADHQEEVTLNLAQVASEETPVEDPVTTGSLQVRVEDEQSEAGIEDIGVRLSDADDQMVTLRTDSQGLVVFDDLTPGDYDLELLDLKEGYHYVIREGQEIYGQAVAVTSGQETQVTLPLAADSQASDVESQEAVGRAQVLVQETTSKEPVPGVSVRAQDANQQMVTLESDSQGLVTFEDLKPGDYIFEVFDFPEDYEFAVTDGQEDFIVEAQVQADETLEVTLPIHKISGPSLESQAQVGSARVLVEDASNEAPIAGVSIRAIDAEDQMVTLTTDEDGLVLFDDLAPGEYFFELYDFPEGYHFTQVNGQEVTGESGLVKGNAQTNVKLYLGSTQKTAGKEGRHLPETGETSSLIWTLSGLALVAAGAGLLIYRRKSE